MSLLILNGVRHEDPSSFEREILVRTNTFFIFFGTEALKAKNLVHERQHLPGNLVS